MSSLCWRNPDFRGDDKKPKHLDGGGDTVEPASTEVKMFPQQPRGDWTPNTSQQIAGGRISIMAAGERLLSNSR